MVNHRGELVDGDEILYIIASHRLTRGRGCNGVVGTLMSNLGLELALEALNVPFERTKVGDRYVIEAMRRNHWPLGGESSGHIVVSDQTTTGDGLVTVLQVLRAMVQTGRSLADLAEPMEKLPQVMINVRLPQRGSLKEDPRVAEAVREAESELGGGGRVLLRPSGTEPVVRVMVEGGDRNQVENLARQIAATVEQVVA